MQDKILLGFLMQGSQTGYAIKKQMEKSTNLFFNTSAGSIYPAFQKLEKEELVTKEERLDGGRAKKIYTITPKGKTAFKEWLNNDLPIGKIKQEALLRTFFFSHLPPAKRIDKLKNYIDEITGKQNELIALKKAIGHMEIDQFQLAALQYGIDLYGFIIQWYNKFLEDLEQ